MLAILLHRENLNCFRRSTLLKILKFMCEQNDFADSQPRLTRTISDSRCISQQHFSLNCNARTSVSMAELVRANNIFHSFATGRYNDFN